MHLDAYPADAAPWPQAVAWSRAELRHYLAAAAGPGLGALPTRCPPWTVRDLTVHLAETFRRYADLLARGRAGDLAPPFAPGSLPAENQRAVDAFGGGDPAGALRHEAERFLGAVADPAEMMPHQFGPIPVGLQVMFGLNELAVHHDDLARATGRSRRPERPVVTALAAMYGAVYGLPGDVGDDPWERLLRATGR
ncbi:maleylpyruvate isomerase family mycothiol-dependent enzyme [Streptomyces sp. MP131-18]|uniref:maleylpyruvate isomerase family mycothiol-dependent enzyme n=1 Tax=Streptomyces sp. MP131-18 TaxID=1857892 RepID=UPI00097CA20C|nr:maleylpyruvate isomerase family mycothiol-dependent enzyme [Streptomyces sp. MP131-18]ONK12666.1 putative Actinobacterial protein [Streptomyces sp. MP131-18]